MSLSLCSDIDCRFIFVWSCEWSHLKYPSTWVSFFTQPKNYPSHSLPPSFTLSHSPELNPSTLHLYFSSLYVSLPFAHSIQVSASFPFANSKVSLSLSITHSKYILAPCLSLYVTLTLPPGGILAAIGDRDDVVLLEAQLVRVLSGVRVQGYHLGEGVSFRFAFWLQKCRTCCLIHMLYIISNRLDVEIRPKEYPLKR